MEDVQRRLAEGKYDQAAKACEQVELHASDSSSQNSSEVYSIQIVSHLISNKLNDARLCWKRIPSALRQEGDIRSVGKVLESLWDKDYVGFHRNVASSQWSSAIQGPIHALVEEVRLKIEGVIAQAYTTISLGDLASILGSSRDQVLRAIERNGWELDTSSAMVTVKSSAGKAAPIKPIGARASLQEMTKYVVHLDST
jgi:alkylated DNA nucleotide flippase Atl1